MGNEQSAFGKLTFVVVMHAREPWDEATFWVVPGRCTNDVVHGIANGSPPKEAVCVLGPANMDLIAAVTKQLEHGLRPAGVEVTIDALSDDWAVRCPMNEVDFARRSPAAWDVFRVGNVG